MKKIIGLLFFVAVCGFAFAQQPEKVELYPIEHHGDLYYMGSKAMTNVEYFDFIKKNCPEAWNSYQKGCNLWKSGIIVGAVGMGCFAVGCGILMAGIYANIGYDYTTDEFYYRDNGNVGMVAAGSVLLCSGAIMQATAVPLMVVGGLKKWGSRRVYNNSCARMNQMTLNLQTSNKGVGLSLNF